jgi:MFS family permease
VGALPALAINAATYLTSQVSIASVASFGPERPGGFPAPSVIGRDVRDGFRFVFGDRTMRTLTYSSAAMNAVAIFGFVAMIPFLKHDFGASDQTVGFAFGCFALGSVAGSLVAGRTHWPFGRALAVVYVLDGLFWLPIIWTQSLAVAIGAVTLCAACGAYEVTSIVSWRMRVVPEEMVGRVFGVVRLLVLSGMVPGSILGGVIADHWGTRAVMGISGFAFLLLALNLLSSRAVLSERR